MSVAVQGPLWVSCPLRPSLECAYEQQPWRINGFPVWQSRAGYLLYSTPNGKWMVTDKGREGAAAARGVLQSTPHAQGARAPWDPALQWDVACGGRWRPCIPAAGGAVVSLPQPRPASPPCPSPRESSPAAGSPARSAGGAADGAGPRGPASESAATSSPKLNGPFHSFRSDNAVGMADAVLQALIEANGAPCCTEWGAYGDDPLTRSLHSEAAAFFEIPQEEADHLVILPVPSGTAANVVLLRCAAAAHGGGPGAVLLAHECSHIHTDELEQGGLRSVVVGRGNSGKLRAADLRDAMDAHRSVLYGGIACLTLSQPTESGTVYTPEELSMLCALAHDRGLLVHVDGARFLNAAAALGCSPADLSWRAGVDFLTFGGSKAGAAADAAVVFDRRRLPDSSDSAPGVASGVLWRAAKAGGHLASKQRFLSAQLRALLRDGYGLQLARQANAAAAQLADGLSAAGVHIAHRCEANSVFAVLPAAVTAALRQAGFGLYDWTGRPDTSPGEVRLVCSFRTTAADVDAIVTAVSRLLRQSAPAAAASPVVAASPAAGQVANGGFGGVERAAAAADAG
eukprot:TRINITY_DN56415_c0_g1_i1.p1 TRINITY_DN56415_c0_g1~~TRINITY_DN56415_c0_g1_i1.p1  ORF type:complete len:571 (+),score=78.54 TRINITY_DN56415_c0_g1_i1:92-1804(+)